MQYVCVDCGFRSCISIAGQIGIAMQDFHAKFKNFGKEPLYLVYKRAMEAINRKRYEAHKLANGCLIVDTSAEGLETTWTDG